jgi:hypothetical protein
MVTKITIYHNLKKNITDKEKCYERALEDFECCISRINRGIIHGKKEQQSLNMIKTYVSNITRASYEMELAYHKLHMFLDKGVIL